MSYIQLDTGYYTHRKTWKLQALLGDAAKWVMPALWCYALQNQPDGDFSGWEDKELALAIGFNGDPALLQQSLLASGYMTDGGHLYGWEERQSYVRGRKAKAVKAALARWEGEEEKEEKERKQASLEHSPSMPQASAEHKPVRSKGSREECMAYCQEIGLTPDDGEWFFDKMEGNGWTNGKATVKDWRATLRSWKRAGYIASNKQVATSKRAPSWSDIEYSKAQVAKLRDDYKFANLADRALMRLAIAKHEAVIGGGK